MDEQKELLRQKQELEKDFLIGRLMMENSAMRLQQIEEKLKLLQKEPQ